MNHKEKFIQLLNDTPLDHATKELAIQLYCLGFSEGKSAAFKEALEIVSYPKPKKGEQQ
jgi:hypothetical protein